MKKALVVVVLSAVLPGMMFAQNATDFTIRTKSFNGTLGVVIMGYQGAQRTVVIPSQFNGIPVMEVGDQAFMLNEITSVVIPRTVLRIGKQAFYGNKLAEVNIPESVREIGDNAFDSNLNFRSIRDAAPVTPVKAALPAQESRFVPAPAPIPVKKETVVSSAGDSRYQMAQAPAALCAPVLAPPPPKETAQVRAPATPAPPVPALAQKDAPPPARTPAREDMYKAAAPVPPPPVRQMPRRIVLPEESRSFEAPATLVFPDDGGVVDYRSPEARRSMNPPIQNEQIPQRYAKAPPPLAAPTHTYSAVIPPQSAGDKYPVVESADTSAEDAERSGDFGLTVGDNGLCAITSYRGGSRDVTVPVKVGAYTPSVVGKLAFWNKYLTTLKLPNTIMRIEDSAFASNSLTHVVVPETVRYIGYQAFNGNPIQRITIGAAVPMQTDSFPALFADFYRINGMIAGTYFLANGKWFIDK